MFNVYNQHHRANVKLPSEWFPNGLPDVLTHAKYTAKSGSSAFYRIFEVQADGSEHFRCAVSVLQGRRHRVKVLRRVTFPLYHW